jgi:hypothetical protein
MYGRLGPYRFYYSVSGTTVFGRFGGARVFVSVLSGGTMLGRVAGSRSNCAATGDWYFCRGAYVEALLPIAAYMLTG